MHKEKARDEDVQNNSLKRTELEELYFPISKLSSISSLEYSSQVQLLRYCDLKAETQEEDTIECRDKYKHINPWSRIRVQKETFTFMHNSSTNVKKTVQ